MTSKQFIYFLCCRFLCFPGTKDEQITTKYKRNTNTKTLVSAIDEILFQTLASISAQNFKIDPAFVYLESSFVHFII
ncbi:hypothetical protein P7M41_26460, partial [Vibrio parahaemolyticus]|nr:hypothetical protein [Vibrio parahaemolyticus]